MRNTKEKIITAEGFTETLKELLKENIVGLVQKEGGKSFDFIFPGGKTFRVSVEETPLKNNF